MAEWFSLHLYGVIYLFLFTNCGKKSYNFEITNYRHCYQAQIFLQIFDFYFDLKLFT